MHSQEMSEQIPVFQPRRPETWDFWESFYRSKTMVVMEDSDDGITILKTLIYHPKPTTILSYGLRLDYQARQSPFYNVWIGSLRTVS